jgi:anti-anti-sigma regulatory factor
VPPQTPVAEQVSVSAWGHQMTANQERAQWEVNPSGVSLVSISASPLPDDVAVRDTVINDDFIRRRADNLNAEAEQTITIARGGAGYAYITLQGHPDHDGDQRLRTQLGAVLDSGARYLTVDLSDLAYCDELMFDVLDWAACRASSQQGWLALTGGHRHIRFTTR